MKMWGLLFAAFCLLRLTLSSGEKYIKAFPGDDVVFQWTLNPIPNPPSSTAVKVLHESRVLFTALNTDVTKSTTDISSRVTGTNNINISGGNIAFTLKDIRLSDAGNYQTKYVPISGNDILETVIAKLVVYGKPSQPSIKEVSPPVVGTSLILSCNATSNSKPDNQKILKMTYKWFLNGVALRNGGRYILSNSQLEMKGTLKGDSGRQFSCKAFEVDPMMSNFSAAYTVDVQFGPEPIDISPTAKKYSLHEHNESLNEITCTSNCKPLCRYSWTRNGQRVSSEQVLGRINNIIRNQAGQYVCKIENAYGTRNITVTIIVQYAPDTPVLRINDGNSDVREGSPITFTCTTQSVPRAKLILVHGSNMTALVRTDISILTISHANCLDTGSFYCSAENSIGTSRSTGVNINVLCKPRPDHRVSQTLKQALGYGENMNISGTLIANPPATIYWSMQLNGTSYNLTNEDEGFEFHQYDEGITTTARASRTAMTKQYFGEYWMHAYNVYGKSMMKFFVSPKRKPDAPEILTLLCKLGSPIRITFAPNFDGGDTQIFSIRMKSNPDAPLKEVSDELQDTNEDEITLRGPSLEPGVFYFSISAKNSFGTTISSNQQNCIIEKETSNLAALIGGVSAGALLIFVIVIGVCIFLKRRKTKEKYGKNGRGKKNKSGQQYGNIDQNSIPNQIDGDVYENTPKPVASEEKPSRKTNDDGLVYIDVEIISKNTNQTKGVIHGIENKNEYAEVVFTPGAAPPAPDNEDEEVDNATGEKSA